MSHEIRTPLNGIIGFTRLTLRTRLSTVQEDYLRKIVVSSNTLLALINDILDLSKIEAGRLEFERIDFRLSQVLEEELTLFSGPAESKGLSLRSDLAPDVPEVLVGDPLRLRQVLNNLVNNAVKYTDRGEIVIAVRALPEAEGPARDDGGDNGPDDGPVTLRFEVHDTGEGIDPDTVGKLFDWFTQADVSTTRKHGGTGLGLAICRQLVSLMGGSIGVESALGEGATFYFELPFPRGSEARLTDIAHQPAGPWLGQGAVLAGLGQAEPVSPPARDGRTTTTDRARKLSGIRVLVVEDNPINQKVAAGFLGAEGVEVDIARHGLEALAMLARTPYHAVLMDMQMPEMDGYEACRRMREDERFARIPIIAMTAHAMVGDREKCLAAGADDYLAKPIDPACLMAALDRWVNG